MDLYKEILIKLLEKENVVVTFPDLALNEKEMVESECCRILQKIKAILENDSLDDKECFMKIEQMVCVFEECGSHCGYRHDFD